MSDLKISQLPLAATLTGAEPWPVVQSGVTVQTKGSDLANYLSSVFLPVHSGLSVVLQNNNDTGSHTIVFSSLNANTVPVLNSSKALLSSAVTPTELGYLSGVTSGVQAQLTAALTMPLSTVLVNGNTTGSRDIIFSNQNTDTVPVLDSTKKLVSSAVTPTELGYVSGVTGGIQTQLNTALAMPLSTVLANNNSTGAHDIVFANQTANKVPYLNSSGVLVSSSVTPTELGYMSGVTSGVQSQLNTALAMPLSTVLTNNSSTGAHDITFANQTASTVPYFDSANKLVSSAVTPTELSYVSGVSSGIQTQLDTLKASYWKEPCVVSTTSGSTIMSDYPTVDGVTLTDGNRVLVQFQSIPKLNGIYVVRAGAWSRAADFDTNSDHIAGAVISILSGSTYRNKAFICTNTGAVNVGTDSLSFTMFGGLTYTGVTGQISVSGSTIGLDPSALSGCLPYNTPLSIILANGSTTGMRDITFANQTATTVPYLNSSKVLVSSSVTPTELGYVSGVTSGLQTQLNTLSGMTLSTVLTNNGSTGAHDITFANQTATTVPYLNSSKVLVSSSVTPTELGYVSGVTSGIQSQIDTLKTSLFWKEPCTVASSSNITLSGAQTIDGVFIGDQVRVLVRAQSDPAKNGIYLGSGGAWARSADFDDGSRDNLGGAVISILDGAYRNKAFMCANTGTISIGSTSLSFVPFNATAYTGTAGQINIADDHTISLDSSVYSSFLPSSASLSSVLANGSSTGSSDITFAHQTASTVPYLNSSKVLVSSSVTPTELGYVSGVTSGLQTQLTTLSGMTLSTVLTNNGSTGAHDITFANQTATTVPYLNSSKVLVSSSVTPTELGYVSGVTSGIQSQLDTLKASYWKEACVVATTTNITLSDFPTIDGVTVSTADRVLVKSQVSTKENGIYIVRGGAWSRAVDFDANTDRLCGAVVSVISGTANKDKAFICSNTGTVNVGTDGITFTLFGGLTYTGTSGQITVTGSVIALDPTALSGYLPTTTGLSTILANSNSTGSSDITFAHQTASTVPYLNSSKVLVSSSVTPTELGYVSGVTSGIQSQLSTLSGMTLSTVLTNSGSTGAHDITFANQSATTVPYLNSSKVLVSSSVTPTELGYVSGVTSGIQSQLDGISWKNTCVAVTASNISLSGHPTIDGVPVSTGDRVLVMHQSLAKDNGIYIVNSGGGWSRARDFDNGADNLAGSLVAIQDGDDNKNKIFICSTTNPITIGSTSIHFDEFGGGTTYSGTSGQITVSGGVISIDSSYEPALSNTQLAVGNGSNKLSSGSNLTFDGSTFYVYGNITDVGVANSTGNILQADSSGTLVGSDDLTFKDAHFIVNGDITAVSMAGTGDRLVTADIHGTLSAGSETIEQWITNEEFKAQLESADNWSDRNYYGSDLSGTYQSQTHFDSSYFFICTSDGNWIRMARA